MNHGETPINRWSGYALHGGSKFASFWGSLVNAERRDLLFIVGQGFDPRMCTAVASILDAGGEGNRDCVVVEFDEGPASPSKKHQVETDANANMLDGLFSGNRRISRQEIKMWSDDGRRRVGSRRAAQVFQSADELTDYTDILLDINAMPRSLYMPMLAKLLYLIDGLNDPHSLNLHVLTSNDPALDRSILAGGLSDDATYLHGFESGIEQEATEGVPKVWMPILGEGKTSHFERIYDLVTPDEIVPILPFPCANPRRTDNVFLEYRAHLFDRLRIEPTNFMYVPEQNPFGVYRQIVSAVKHYSDALEPLSGCKVIISALSSKLLSLGGLLAAYDLKLRDYRVGIAHVEAEGYTMNGDAEGVTSAQDLFDIWVTGEPYARQ